MAPSAASAPGPVGEATTPAVAMPVSVAAAAASAPAEPASVLELRASAESWVEVLDAGGASLLQRSLQPGEFVGLDGTPPFRLRIGNAAVTQLRYRGQPVDLGPATRDNVARIELK
jgi:cytoskeleton protein RodZ